MSVSGIGLVHFVLAIVLSPLLSGVINRTKALFAGRRGQPLLQQYFDLYKLAHRSAVYSQTTTWVFRMGPIVNLSAIFTAVAVVPFAGSPALLAFQGDFLLFAYLMALSRFSLIVAALDTGSSFEGMGASREAQFSALAEPTMLLSIAAIAWLTGDTSLSGMTKMLSFSSWASGVPVLGLVIVSLFVVFLAENSRIPIDDPNTHLELTMIHEVMVLDHSGPDFSFILYAASLKLWVFGELLINVILPVQGVHPFGNLAVALVGMFGVALLVGIIESSRARLRLVQVPHLLVGAGALSAIALILSLR